MTQFRWSISIGQLIIAQTRDYFRVDLPLKSMFKFQQVLFFLKNNGIHNISDIFTEIL